MSSFILKVIGIITMLLDHIGIAFYDHSFFRIIGRLAFPIFAFQSIVAYEHTRNKKKYLFKLLIFGIISQIPFYLMKNSVNHPFLINVMFTILLGLISIIVFNRFTNKIMGFISVVLIGILCSILRIDYGFFGILTIFLFYYYRNNFVKAAFSFSFLFIIRYILFIIYFDTIYYLLILLATLLALVPISLYNKKEGIKTRYLFYVFYPLHMLIIFIIKIII